MSGPMTTELAAAASRYAAEAAATNALLAEASTSGLSVGRFIQRRFIEQQAAKRGGGAESLPGRTWRAMDLRTRSVLVMLAASFEGDARAYAARAWEALTPADQVSIAACARTLGRDLRRASCLF